MTRKHILLAAGSLVAAAFLASQADATLILNFDTVGATTGTETAGTTTVTATDIAADIGFSIAPIVNPELFSLSATNISPASIVAGDVVQDFSGTFCISTGAGCTGVIALKGTFIDAAFGPVGGTGLTFTVSNGAPGESLTLSSTVAGISAHLGGVEDVSFGISDVTPHVGITGGSLASFTGNLAGTVSATGGVTGGIPEPSIWAMLGLGFAALGFAGYRRTRRDQSSAFA